MHIELLDEEFHLIFLNYKKFYMTAIIDDLLDGIRANTLCKFCLTTVRQKILPVSGVVVIIVVTVGVVAPGIEAEFGPAENNREDKINKNK